MGITYETPEEKNALISGIRQDLAKKHGIEDTEDNVLLDELAKTEFSRRETQASFTKGQQTLKTVEAEKSFLYEKLEKSLDLSVAQDEKLQELKHEDPDKYIETVGKLKKQKKEEFDATITEGLSHAGSEASKNFALSRREEIYKEFSEANPEVNITDQVVRDQLPPVLLVQLANNEISFEDFLETAKRYVVVEPKKGGNNNDKKDLDDKVGRMPGSSKASKEAVNQSFMENYSTQII